MRPLRLDQPVMTLEFHPFKENLLVVGLIDGTVSM